MCPQTAVWSVAMLVLSATFDGGLTAPQAQRQYPAGVDPRLCPSFPVCDNKILAEYAKNPLPIQKKLENGELDHFFFSAPGYPVGLSPIQCPNYPFCS